MTWSTADLADLSGTTAVVTGANTGIGFETAAALAGAGATTVLACRDLGKAAAAREQLLRRGVTGPVEVLQLDLADQRQVATAAAETLERFPVVDRLVNNAGVMSPVLARTADGFETAFGTNHLGHFAYTGRVLPALLAAPGSRVVTVSSMSHRVGRIEWDVALHGERYRAARAYAQSKLANLLFAFGLQERLAGAGARTVSLAAHPGFAATDFLSSGTTPTRSQRVQKRLGERLVPSPAEAARASLRAATDPAARGGEYYGPKGLGGVRGAPVLATPGKRSLDREAQSRLWDLSVELTGVTYPLPDLVGS